MNERNIDWVLKCINSCTNNQQLDCCEIIIALYKFKLAKDQTDEKLIHTHEGILIEAYINKRASIEIVI
jgi:hypothetical protein